MYRVASIAATFVLASTIAGSAWARQPASVNDWSHGTTLSGFGGVTVTSEQTGSALGGAAGWEVTPNLAIEGLGAWSDFGSGTTSFAGSVKARFRILGQRKIDPYVAGGIGLYRTTFGSSESAMPMFYKRRMVMPESPAGLSRTFTDPSVVGGGGVSLFVNRHVALRPDAEAAIVFRDGHTHVVTTIAMHVVYHFENHPVTPALGR